MRIKTRFALGQRVYVADFVAAVADSHPRKVTGLELFSSGRILVTFNYRKERPWKSEQEFGFYPTLEQAEREINRRISN